MEAERLVDQLQEIDLDRLARDRPGLELEREDQVLEAGGEPVSGLGDEARGFEPRLLVRPAFQQLVVADEDGEWCLEIVRDAGDQRCVELRARRPVAVPRLPSCSAQTRLYSSPRSCAAATA